MILKNLKTLIFLTILCISDLNASLVKNTGYVLSKNRPALVALAHSSRLQSTINTPKIHATDRKEFLLTPTPTGMKGQWKNYTFPCTMKYSLPGRDSQKSVT